MIASAVATLRSSRAQGTLIIPRTPHASWWYTLWECQWSPDVVAVVYLGDASSVLSHVDNAHKGIWAGRVVMALHLDCL